MNTTEVTSNARKIRTQDKASGGPTAMSEIAKRESSPIPTDGWDDTAAEAEARVIRGSLLKFADWKWSIGNDKEVTEVKECRQLVAVATAAAWVKWQGGKPVEYRLREPGVPMPERGELGHNDPAEWEIGPDGQPRDPWQSTHFVYLIDPQTAEAFTYSTSSWGGRDCVINLADQIRRMRGKYPDAVPLVELGAAPMSTRFGRKSKPTLTVVGWRNTAASVMMEQPERQLPPPAAAATRAPAVAEAVHDMDDDIPF